MPSSTAAGSVLKDNDDLRPRLLDRRAGGENPPVAKGFQAAYHHQKSIFAATARPEQ